MRRLGPAVATALAALAAGCTSASKASPPGSVTPAPAPTSAAPTSARPAVNAPPATPPRTLPTTTTVTTVPARPAPAPLTPLVSPALTGEGDWRPMGDRLPGGYAVYTTLLRPAAGQPECGVAWIDTRATRLVLYAGAAEPVGSWPQQSYVAPAQRPTLMAAFNSGFKIYSYHTGWYDQGRQAVPLQPGAASLVIRSDGSATVGEWGRDVSMGSDVVAVRQNLTLLVDHGAPVPDAQNPADWGAVLGGGSVTWRSAVGVTAAGDLVYAGGPGLTPVEMADVMVAARAERAMELDINPEWVSFATFVAAAGAVSGTNLLAGMYSAPDHYLQPYGRDFFAVFAR